MSSDFQSSASSTLAPLLEAIRACPYDLVARAGLAINACTRLTDPDRNGLPYSYVEFHTDPPVALHSPWDYYDTAGRLTSALTLARIMTGTAPDEHDEALARLLAANQWEDGLVALPSDPWTATAPVVEMHWSPPAALLGWTTRYLAYDDIESRDRARRLVNALSRRIVRSGDSCWLPATFLPSGGWLDTAPGRITDVMPGAQLVFPLVRFGEATGDEQSLQLAGGLIRYLRDEAGAFERDGRISHKGARLLHSSTDFIRGVLKYGVVTGDDDAIDWAQSAYAYARGRGTEFGFFPREISGAGHGQGDTCVTADMIEIALMLGMNRDLDYFTEAERYGRNHLLESQFTDFRWVEEQAEAEFCPEIWCSNHPPEGITTEAVCARSLGAFAGWSQPNDAFDPICPRLMQRATGSGLRALYDLWRYVVTRTDEAVKVNLHFSCDDRYATVTALEPERGGIEVLMKTKGVLAVRVPPGLNNQQVEVMVNQQRPRQEILRDGYAWLEALQSGDTVLVTWPLEERAETYPIQGRSYTGAWRGDTLLSLDPPGPLAPLYRRSLDGLCPASPHAATGPLKEIETL